MSGKTKTSRKAKLKGVVRSGSGVSPAGPGETVEILEIESAESEDPFVGLFGSGNADDQIIVELRRTVPEFIVDKHGQNIPVKGFLENLPEGLQSYPAYIKEKYGGGTFEAHRKVNHTYRGGKKIEIAGKAKMPGDVISDNGSLSSAGDEDPETVEGIRISGSDEEFRRRLERIAEIKATVRAFSGVGDGANDAVTKQVLQFNQELIALMLKNNQSAGNPLNQIKDLAGIVSAVKELLPESGNAVGAGWPDILKEAIGTVGKLASGQTGRARVNVGALPQGEELPEKSERENDPMNHQQMAAAAVANIVASFKLKKEPERVVRVLDASLQLSKTSRSQLVQYRDLLYDSAELQVSETLEDVDDALLKEFKEYFDKVFDLYIDAERETFKFQG